MPMILCGHFLERSSYCRHQRYCTHISRPSSAIGLQHHTEDPTSSYVFGMQELHQTGKLRLTLLEPCLQFRICSRLPCTAVKTITTWLFVHTMPPGPELVGYNSS